MGLRHLAPGLLLAAPKLGDPNFERTVVLLGRHDSDGALGWVVNGRALARVGDLLRDSALVADGARLPTGAAFDRVARVGGPVSNSSGWLLYRRLADATPPGELLLGEELAVTGDKQAFEAVLRGAAPQDFRLLLGYAGWGPGQLEGEVQAGAWLPCALGASLLLDTPPENLWDAAYREAIGSNPGAFISNRRGSA